jgi:general stress protein 26
MTDSTTTTTSVPPATVPLAWDDLVAAVTRAGDGVFLATADPDGRPHVAFVAPGWADQCLWISTFASSQKAANLRRRPDVAMTCNPSPDVNVLIRAVARCVDDPAEIAERWAEGVLPYDPSAFFSGPDDPEALFVELRPTYASIHSLAPGPIRRWRPS